MIPDAIRIVCSDEQVSVNSHLRATNGKWKYKSPKRLFIVRIQKLDIYHMDHDAKILRNYW